MKSLLEEAASCPAAPLRRLAERGGKVGPDPEDDLPLTPAVWAIRHGPPSDHHLQSLCGAGAPTPIAIVEALESRPVGERGDRLSIRHRDGIVRIRTRPAESGLRGTVWFRVEGLLAGQVEFVARSQAGAWRVVAFLLPKDGLRTTRQDDGTWRLQSTP
jgi:hypothetical protein